MKTVTIKISGMHCAACSNGVERSLKKVPGVDRAEVNLATQSALVRYDENQATIEQLEEAVTRMTLVLSMMRRAKNRQRNRGRNRMPLI